MGGFRASESQNPSGGTPTTHIILEPQDSWKLTARWGAVHLQDWRSGCWDQGLGFRDKGLRIRCLGFCRLTLKTQDKED